MQTTMCPIKLNLSPAQDASPAATYSVGREGKEMKTFQDPAKVLSHIKDLMPKDKIEKTPIVVNMSKVGVM